MESPSRSYWWSASCTYCNISRLTVVLEVDIITFIVWTKKLKGHQGRVEPLSLVTFRQSKEEKRAELIVILEGDRGGKIPHFMWLLSSPPSGGIFGTCRELAEPTAWGHLLVAGQKLWSGLVQQPGPSSGALVDSGDSRILSCGPCMENCKRGQGWGWQWGASEHEG